MREKTRIFLSYYKPYRNIFWADMACAILVAGIALVLPLCTRAVTKGLLAGTATQPYLLRMGAVMTGLIALSTAAYFYVDYRGHSMGAMIETDMRRDLFAHCQTLSHSFYDSTRVGQLMSRITNDLLSLAELYHHGPEDAFIYSVKFVGAAVILYFINARLTLIVLCFLPVMTVYTLYFNKKMHTAMAARKQRIAQVNELVEDSLSGIRVVQSFAQEDAECARFSRENHRFLDSRKAGYLSEAFCYGGATAIGQLIPVAVVVAGGASLARGGADVADLLTFLLYISYFTEPIMRIIQISTLYQEGITGFDRFLEVLSIQPEIRQPPDAVPLTDVKGQLTFEQVTFRYRPEERDVFQNLSLTIGTGEFVALVGASGVGKTTLCALLPRFYDVQGGRILIDGKDIKTVTLPSLRAAIGIVQQEVYLFAGTVRDNIRYGRQDAADEEVESAAMAAGAHEFILALPNGYDTDIGQRGVKLSGGQRQRISIARAILKNPPVLIFDEATSALDNESERVVRDALGRLSKSRTTLVIAHRLSTIRAADRIIVLDGAGVAEQGTHDQLLQRDGVYAKLYRMQASI